MLRGCVFAITIDETLIIFCSSGLKGQEFFIFLFFSCPLLIEAFFQTAIWNYKKIVLIEEQLVYSKENIHLNKIVCIT